MKKTVPLIVLQTDANVSSSISLESLNFAVIFPHWYGTTSENSQVTAYFTETSGIAKCKRPKFYIFNFFSQRTMLTFVLIVCVALHKKLTTPSINVSYIYMNCLIIPLDIMKGITTFVSKIVLFIGFMIFDI